MDRPRVGQREVQKGALVPVSEEGERGVVLHQRADEVQHPRLGEEIEAACENGRVLRFIFPQQVRFRPLVRAAELQDVLNRSQAVVVLDEEFDGFGRHGGAPGFGGVRENESSRRPSCVPERKKDCAIPTAVRDEGPSLWRPTNDWGWATPPSRRGSVAKAMTWSQQEPRNETSCAEARTVWSSDRRT
jgi:hypothetical protein